MEKTEYEKNLDEAILRVFQMDEIDGRKDINLKTIFMALQCGLANPKSGAAYDALVMIADLIVDDPEGEQIYG